MKNKKSKNRFDILVESLTEKFSAIKNFELLSESDETKAIWNFLIQTIVELNSIKALFIGIYVPQTNKYIYDWKQEFQKSIYSSLVKIDEKLWKHEIHKLIRIGYVTLFHKYENFIGNVYKIINENYIEFEDKSITLQQYAIKEFNFKIEGEWYYNEYLKRINWVCNSEKHNDGYPKATHAYYRENENQMLKYPETDKIEISADKLKTDIEFMIEFVQMVFQNIMFIALYRMAEESFNGFDDIEVSKEMDQNEQLEDMKLKIQRIIELTKEF